ncbi:MAG: DNA polymerase III subunit delta' [Alphaproteobacteria bacterium]
MDLFGEPIVEEAEEGGEALPASTPLADDGPVLFEHPRTMPFCIGQEAAEQTLIELLHTGRVPHGLILAGQKGVGKATLAYRLARFLFSGAPIENTLEVDPQSKAFRLVASGGHPDLLTIERVYDATKNKTQETLPVAELRKVEPFLRRTASEGGWRVVIIDDADTMNRNAQNALLKILEEPPKQTMIILITHRIGALIPTIRSRTRTLNCQTLTPDVITDLLTQKGHYIDPYQGETLAAMAEGSFGQALGILEEGGLEMLESVIAFLGDAPDWVKIHHFSDTIAKSNDYKAFTQIMRWLFKTLSFAKARGRALSPASLNEAPLSVMLENSSLARLLEICEKLEQNFETCERANLDKKQAVLKAFQIIYA